MSTLTRPEVSSLLQRLFTEASAADGAIRDELARLSAEERAAFMARARTDYRGFYGEAKTLFLPVSPETTLSFISISSSSGATPPA